MIVTLLSDYGYQDNYIGITKAVLYRLLPDAHIIDIAHDITPHHLLQCAYLLSGSLYAFPAETVHLSLFGVMYQIPPKVLFTQHNNQYIISADNGLLPLISDQNSASPIYCCTEIPANYMEWLKIAAALAGQMGKGTIDWSHLVPYQPEVYPVPLRPVIKDNSIDCNIVHIDRFGNVVLNLRKEEFERYRNNRKFRIILHRNDVIESVSEHYASVQPEERLCLFNSSGYLEIAINQGDASKLLGLKLFDPRQVNYQSIKIEFL
jgi:S-adenosylmethionine hydrolase